MDERARDASARARARLIDLWEREVVYLRRQARGPKTLRRLSHAQKRLDEARKEAGR